MIQISESINLWSNELRSMYEVRNDTMSQITVRQTHWVRISHSSSQGLVQGINSMSQRIDPSDVMHSMNWRVNAQLSEWTVLWIDGSSQQRIRSNGSFGPGSNGSDTMKQRDTGSCIKWILYPESLDQSNNTSESLESMNTRYSGVVEQWTNEPQPTRHRIIEIMHQCIIETIIPTQCPIVSMSHGDNRPVVASWWWTGGWWPWWLVAWVAWIRNN